MRFTLLPTKSTFSSCLCLLTQVLSQTPQWYLCPWKWYPLPSPLVLSMGVSQWGRCSKHSGLAKIGADFPNAAASGIFLRTFVSLPDRMVNFLEPKKGLTVARTNKSFQLANLIQLFHCSSELTILCISSMPFISQANISSVFSCQELALCFIYLKFYSVWNITFPPSD